MAYRDLILRDRPYLYYEFNDWTTKLVDSSGGGVNGTYTSNYLLGQPGMIASPGRSVYCQQSSHISTTTIATTITNSTSSFTVEWWTLSTYGSALDRPWGLDSVGQLGAAALQNYEASNNAGTAVATVVAGTISVYGEDTGNDAYAVTSVGVNVSDGHSHHIVYTRTPTGATCVATLYVDGEFNATFSKTGLGAGTPNTLVLGSTSTGDSAPFNGFLDEFAIYTYILTPAQIRAHYLAGKGHGIDQGAAGLWLPRQRRG